MIPRTLVPLKISAPDPHAGRENGRRHASTLDSRIIVPAELPAAAPLDGHTSIPSHLPLGVLSERILIPRDMPATPLDGHASAIPAHVPLAVRDNRMIVPPEAHLGGSAPLTNRPNLSPRIFEEVIEPDLFTTGEVNLLATPEKASARDWQWVARSFSLLVHVGVLLLILAAPRLFRANQPPQPVELAREQLSRVFLPPNIRNVPRYQPKPEQPSNRIRLDPRILKKIVPPTPAPLEGPKNQAPPEPAPTPAKPAAPVSEPPLQPKPAPAKQAERSAPEFKPLEPQNVPKTHLNLELPPVSPGRALQQSARAALQNRSNSTSAAFSEPMPRAAGPLPSGQAGQGLLGGGVQILTPTNGVDFSNYLARLLARVKENWYSVMPISARMGDKGVVIMRFQIMHNGDMPSGQPLLERTSGKEPLDRAAGSALTESNPFEPLPSAFTGPDIELRIIFLYNLPLDYNYNQ